ncbi:IclR family transcriptional regulator domain-containing protein [Nesterenkonia lutea]|uniref:IclR family pca regulon transcriptional regulator n=1 Tax=Nesterenkonia lutea TaxID=272919 RepID=A0ABR9JC31_9MICC|nr:IclR family transcriptional regulator C-terminal domain-containing protein [Nesterenkonia lutea]MBE1523486.1 IclR family pca regulon transcriptional regulator [Nesterenkonia lutea]
MDQDQPGPPAVSRNEFVRSLSTGLKVLESFSAVEPKLTLSDVARRSDVSRATARRMLLTLVHEGYAYTDGRFFELTPKVLGLGQGYWSGRGWHELLQPSLGELSGKLAESCSAALLVDDEVMYVCRVHTRRIMRIDLALGTKLPAFVTSMGRVLLSALDDRTLEDRLQATSRTAFTDRTVTDPVQLRQIITQVRRDGYAVVDEELEEGLRSVAVPARDSTGRIVLSLNTSISAGKESAAESVERTLPHLLRCASAVEDLIRSLGDDVARLTVPQGL